MDRKQITKYDNIELPARGRPKKRIASSQFSISENRMNSHQQKNFEGDYRWLDCVNNQFGGHSAGFESESIGGSGFVESQSACGFGISGFTNMPFVMSGNSNLNHINNSNLGNNPNGHSGMASFNTNGHSGLNALHGDSNGPFNASGHSGLNALQGDSSGSFNINGMSTVMYDMPNITSNDNSQMFQNNQKQNMSNTTYKTGTPANQSSVSGVQLSNNGQIMNRINFNADTSETVRKRQASMNGHNGSAIHTNNLENRQANMNTCNGSGVDANNLGYATNNLDNRQANMNTCNGSGVDANNLGYATNNLDNRQANMNTCNGSGVDANNLGYEPLISGFAPGSDAMASQMLNRNMNNSMSDLFSSNDPFMPGMDDTDIFQNTCGTEFLDFKGFSSKMNNGSLGEGGMEDHSVMNCAGVGNNSVLRDHNNPAIKIANGSLFSGENNRGDNSMVRDHNNPAIKIANGGLFSGYNNRDDNCMVRDHSNAAIKIANGSLFSGQNMNNNNSIMRDHSNAAIKIANGSLFSGQNMNNNNSIMRDHSNSPLNIQNGRLFPGEAPNEDHSMPGVHNNASIKIQNTGLFSGDPFMGNLQGFKNIQPTNFSLRDQTASNGNLTCLTNTTKATEHGIGAKKHYDNPNQMDGNLSNHSFENMRDFHRSYNEHVSMPNTTFKGPLNQINSNVQNIEMQNSNPVLNNLKFDSGVNIPNLTSEINSSNVPSQMNIPNGEFPFHPSIHPTSNTTMRPMFNTTPNTSFNPLSNTQFNPLLNPLPNTSFGSRKDNSNIQTVNQMTNSSCNPGSLPNDLFMSGNPWLNRKKRKSNPLVWQYMQQHKETHPGLVHPSRYSSYDYIKMTKSHKMFIGTVKRQQSFPDKNLPNYTVLPLFINSTSYYENKMQNSEFEKIAKIFLRKTENLDYENVTVQQLKCIMKEFGLNHTGKKIDLIERIKHSIDTLQRKLEEIQNKDMENKDTTDLEQKKECIMFSKEQTQSVNTQERENKGSFIEGGSTIDFDIQTPNMPYEDPSGMDYLFF